MTKLLTYDEIIDEFAKTKIDGNYYANNLIYAFVIHFKFIVYYIDIIIQNIVTR